MLKCNIGSAFGLAVRSQNLNLQPRTYLSLVIMKATTFPGSGAPLVPNESTQPCEQLRRRRWSASFSERSSA